MLSLWESRSDTSPRLMQEPILAVLVAVYSEEEQASNVERVFNRGLPGSAGTAWHSLYRLNLLEISDRLHTRVACRASQAPCSSKKFR